MKKTNKTLIIPVLLFLSFSAQANATIYDKLNCAANAYMINLFFEDNPSNDTKLANWVNTVNYFSDILIDSGKSEKEAKLIIGNAVKNTFNVIDSIVDDSEPVTIRKKIFINWLDQTYKCVNNYFYEKQGLQGEA